MRGSLGGGQRRVPVADHWPIDRAVAWPPLFQTYSLVARSLPRPRSLVVRRVRFGRSCRSSFADSDWRPASRYSASVATWLPS
jgi:hypothetical protein